MKPIQNSKELFECLEEGLQRYFDNHDPEWGGIMHLTVGVRFGEVGGIIKSENMLSYEGFTLHRIETILRYVLPRFVSRDSVPYAIAAVLDELRVEKTPSDSGNDTTPAEEPKPKKPRTLGRRRKQK